MIDGLRGILPLVLVVALGATAGHAAEVLRLTGAVNYRTYPGVAKLLFDTLEKPIVLDLTIPVDNEEADGHLTTFVLDGQFELAYLAGPDRSKLYADNGFELVGDSHYTLKGNFTVQSAGVHSGIPYLALEPAEIPADATFNDVAAASLEPAD